MKSLFALCLVALLVLVGCSEEEKPAPAQTKNIDWDKRIAAAANKEAPPAESAASSRGGVRVTIAPQVPTAGDCLSANVKGKPSRKVFVWEVNGILVQQGEANRYCLEGARRDDTVTVTVGDDQAGGTASVTVGNTPPQILDTQIELAAEGDRRYLVVTPEVEDVDEDYVSLEYQWLINGEVKEDFAENRLPADAFQKGDEVQVRILTDDGYTQGPVYLSRNINVPGRAPNITSRPPGAFESLEFTYQVEASDPDGGKLTYSLAAAPEGMTIDAETGEVTWPLDEVAPGAYPVKIVVTDPDGDSAVQEFTLNLGERKAAARE